MYIEECLRNLKCDTAGCHSNAKYNINTSGYKGNLCLCEKCFNNLYDNVNKIKKSQTSKLIKNKGENNAK